MNNYCFEINTIITTCRNFLPWIYYTGRVKSHAFSHLLITKMVERVNMSCLLRNSHKNQISCSFLYLLSALGQAREQNDHEFQTCKKHLMRN